MIKRKSEPKPLAVLQKDEVELNLAIIRQFAQKLEEWPVDLTPDEADWLADALWRIGESREDPAEVFGIKVRGRGKKTSLTSAEKKERVVRIVASVTVGVEARVGKDWRGEAFKDALDAACRETGKKFGIKANTAENAWNKHAEYRSSTFSALTSQYKRKKPPRNPSS